MFGHCVCQLFKIVEKETIFFDERKYVRNSSSRPPCFFDERKKKRGRVAAQGVSTTDEVIFFRTGGEGVQEKFELLDHTRKSLGNYNVRLWNRQKETNFRPQNQPT